MIYWYYFVVFNYDNTYETVFAYALWLMHTLYDLTYYFNGLKYLIFKINININIV